MDLALRLPALTPVRRRAIRDGLILAGFMLNFEVVVLWGVRVLWSDADSWWRFDQVNLYGLAEQSLIVDRAFRLAPVFAWLLAPLSALSWGQFIALFVTAELIAIVVLARRWTPVVLLAFPPVLWELLNGNIHIFLALAIWLGMRYPAAWSVVLLTKVTPGVGVVWFASRKEWRHLAMALGTTAAIFIAGSMVAPDLWLEWLRSLAISTSHPVPTSLPPLWIRYFIAILIAWYAGRSGRAWMVPIVCFVAMPTIWNESFALLLACLPLWRERHRFAPMPASSTMLDRDLEATTA